MTCKDCQDPEYCMSFDCVVQQEQEILAEYNADTLEEWDYATCEHGVYKGLVGGFCSACDAYEESRGGLDKCLNCGRYTWGDELGADQTCKKGCVNPNEY